MIPPSECWNCIFEELKGLRNSLWVRLLSYCREYNKEYISELCFHMWHPSCSVACHLCSPGNLNAFSHRALPDEMLNQCLLCFRLQPQVQIPAQRDAATHQQKSSPAAGSGGKDAAALHGCTMEQLPWGTTAFNTCTLEQLPQGSRVCSPAVASPFMDRSSSPVVMPAALLAGQGPGLGAGHGPGLGAGHGPELAAGHGPGLGAGLRGAGHGPGLGAGLSARNAVAALCSARRQTAEPRNAYRWVSICPGAFSILAHAWLSAARFSHHQVSISHRGSP